MGKFSRNTELDTPRFAMDFLVETIVSMGFSMIFPYFLHPVWHVAVTCFEHLQIFQTRDPSIRLFSTLHQSINYWGLNMDCAQNSFEIQYIGPLYTIIINGHDGWRLTLFFYRKTMVVPSSSNHEWSNGWMVVWNMNFIVHNIWDNPSHWLSYFSRWFKSPTSIALYTIIYHYIPLCSIIYHYYQLVDLGVCPRMIRQTDRQ